MNMKPRTLLWSALLSVELIACGGAASAPSPPAAAIKGAEVPCSQHTYAPTLEMTDDGVGLTSSFGLAAGRYALPADSKPLQLVVMFHGHLNDSCDWRRHLQQVAAHGAIAVAMDYSGQLQTPVENYGWRVREGAADSIEAAKYFLAQYPSITQVIAFGISMGGNSSGLAVASPDAQRADGSPLFDYWIDVEGVNNLIEEYFVARGVAAIGNAGGALAQQEIEEEAGGSFEQVPDQYAQLTNVYHAAEMATLRGAVIVNAIDDGLVPTNQSPEMAAALNLVGTPAHLFTVLGNGGAETGTTFTSNAGDPLFGAAGQTYTSPFAGHGWEGSDTQLVIKTGFDQLWKLLEGGAVVAGETVVPGL
jgi:pimeloyl-ACP methyl ester carboxylesterase